MYQPNEKDELKARFTRWMEVTLFRARKHYLAKIDSYIPTIPLDEILVEAIASNTDERIGMDSFDFQEERLSNAFSRLSPRKQAILTMLIAQERKPADVAQLLHCTPQQIYDQRYQALKALRKELQGGGEN